MMRLALYLLGMVVVRSASGESVQDFFMRQCDDMPNPSVAQLTNEQHYIHVYICNDLTAITTIFLNELCDDLDDGTATFTGGPIFDEACSDGDSGKRSLMDLLRKRISDDTAKVEAELLSLQEREESPASEKDTAEKRESDDSDAAIWDDTVERRSDDVEDWGSWGSSVADDVKRRSDDFEDWGSSVADDVERRSDDVDNWGSWGSSVADDVERRSDDVEDWGSSVANDVERRSDDVDNWGSWGSSVADDVERRSDDVEDWGSSVADDVERRSDDVEDSSSSMAEFDLGVESEKRDSETELDDLDAALWDDEVGKRSEDVDEFSSYNFAMGKLQKI